MKTIYHCEVFDPLELIKPGEAEKNCISLSIDDYNAFLSTGTELHMFSGEADGERRIEKALANAMSPNDRETILNRSVALMVVISCNQTTMSSILMEEMVQLHDFIKLSPSSCSVKWGIMRVSNLSSPLKIAILAVLP